MYVNVDVNVNVNVDVNVNVNVNVNVCIIFCSYGGSMEAAHMKPSLAAIVCFSLKPTGGPLPWPDAGGVPVDLSGGKTDK